MLLILVDVPVINNLRNQPNFSELFYPGGVVLEKSQGCRTGWKTGINAGGF